MNTRKVKDFIRSPYAWPGGYPLMAVTSDGGCLCKDCCKSEWWLICYAIRKNLNDGWRVDGIDINWEDENLLCDHCGNKIESAYGEDR